MVNTVDDNNIKKTLLVSSFILFSFIFIGLIFFLSFNYNADNNLSYSVWIIIAYIAGLSMIVLPCTMPLVFIIIPLSSGSGYKKGFIMSLLFGFGLIITITLYSATIAEVGNITSLHSISTVIFFASGIVAFLFGLVQLNLINLRLPTYSGVPKFIQECGDYGKSFFMGLLLGNVGVGCPNPMFYWLLVHIAGTGSLETGTVLGLVHGVGRAVPLIFISIITIIGINIKKTLIEKRNTIETVTGFMLVIVGSFLIINGIPGGHEWYEETVVHKLWNNTIENLSLPSELVTNVHAHKHDTAVPKEIIPIILLILVCTPFIFYMKARKCSNVDGKSI